MYVTNFIHFLERQCYEYFCAQVKYEHIVFLVKITMKWANTFANNIYKIITLTLLLYFLNADMWCLFH
jgi:hypothetical protein